MSKMTDEQIKKALEVCSTTNMALECKNCPYDIFNARNCSIKLCEDALDLINRQQETIGTLRSCVEQHHIIRKDGKSPLSLLTAEIKAEAIKEYMKILEEKLSQNTDISNVGYQSIIFDMEQVYKEMVGK